MIIKSNVVDFKKYLFSTMCFFKHIIVFLLFNISINVYSQIFNEKNIGTGFEIPVNIWTINTPEDDFAPCFIYPTNELYYNSIVGGYSKYFVSHIQPITDDTIANNIHCDVSFSQPQQLNSQLNQSLKNIAYFAVIPSNINPNRYAFVNASAYYNTGNYVNIQKTIFERNTWSQPVPIAEFSGEYFIGHPTVSPSGDLLVFASNKNSNNGTTDLWIALMNSEQNWDMLAPIDELNSVGNEITPHFVSDSLLLFASDGFDGIGGYDLYYSFYSGGKWSKPIPLEDINTELDETDPLVLMNRYLVLASDRPGGRGKLDLYITMPKLLDTIQKMTYNFSLSATNYVFDINKTLVYDLISNEAMSSISSNDTIEIFMDTTFAISPQYVEFSMEADSNTSSLQLRYTIECNQTTLYVDSLNFNNKTNTSWIVNFAQWSATMFNADTIVMNIYHKQELLKSLPMEIIKTETKEIKKHYNNGQNYYKVITAIADNIKDYLHINNDIINSLSELINYNKSVEISISKLINTNQILKEIQKHLKISGKSNLVSTTTNSNLIIFKIII